MLSKRLLTLIWFLSLVIFLFLAAQPVGASAQFMLGAAVAAAMAAVWLSGRGGPWRIIFLALGITMVLRYVYWRTTSTLPAIDDPVNFIPGVILYAMEMFSVTMLFISLFIVSDPLERPAARQLDAEDLPTIDVFVPTYNEERELLATTLAAAKGMDYPPEKLSIYLLDDGGSDQKCHQADPIAAHAARERRRELMQLCRDLGVNYLTRERNVQAKAGNMNAALPRTSGELIAIFDADHAPVREFLRQTVGHFRDDERLFLVQTPHFFLNPDPIEKNLSTFNTMPSENEMFYGVIQKGLDKWNGAFFCGSAAVIRRAAVEEAGGFDGVSITEDCETALSLHARGWNSLYVDRPLIAGLQPETFASFIGQRHRWCTGMMQILLLKNPLFRRGLKPAQRLAYLSSSLFWLFPLPRLTFVFAPLLYIFLSMEIFEASISEFIAYTTFYMIGNLMMQNYLYGKVRWPWISELYEYVQSVYLIRSIVGTVLNPRKPTFNVTAKGQTLEKETLSELAFPYFVLFAVLAVAEAVVIWRWFTDPGASDLLAVVGLWNTLNLVIAGLALGVVTEKQERRHSQRLAIQRRGALNLAGTTYQVVIEDVSMGGARVRPLAGRIPVDRVGGTLGTLAVAPSVPGAGIATLNVSVRRQANDDRGVFFGLAFLDLSPDQFSTVADLMYAASDPLSQFREKRRRNIGIFGGTVRVLNWSLYQITRGLAVAGRERTENARRPKAVKAESPAAPPASATIGETSPQT